jgi:hypothetical protein
VKTRLDADCGSEDELLTATVRIKRWKLDIDNIPEVYETEFKQKLAKRNIQRGNPKRTCKALKQALKEVAEKNIPKKEKKNRTTWMSQDTLTVVENRHKLKMEGN